MATLEQEKSFGERNGERVRNVGIVLVVVGLFPPLNALVLPALGFAAGGEVFRRVSKPKGQN